MSAVIPAVLSLEEKFAAVPTDMIWRLRVDQYHLMVQAGILTEDDPVELLDGWLVTKMPKNPRHRVVTQLAREALARVFSSGWYVDAQEPITTADSEPEPDVVVVRGERRQYLDRHPSPQDIALVVEVADSTLRRDRSLKKGIYATAGISIYWIINLIENQVEVYTEPFRDGEQPNYRQQQHYSLEEQIPIIADGRVIGSLSVREVLS
jgi:Uma2 family endonuclease